MQKLEASLLNRLPHQELLKYRLCDLPIALEVPWFIWARGLIEKQLQKRKLRLKPHYWVSDEWFCPDGVPGIAVPFFLLHPRLMELEKEMLGFVDGSTPLKRLKILRHEMGHVVDNAYRLRKGVWRRELFGDSRARYPDSYDPQIYSRSYVRHLGAAYAQSHPDEDFAETFAVWLQPKKQWRVRYKNTPALKKLEFINLLMKQVEGLEPVLRNTRRVDPLERNTLTLKEYYRQKRRKYGLERQQARSRQFLLKLQRAASSDCRDRSRQMTLHLLLQRHSQDVLRESSQALKAPKYKLEPLFRQYEQMARKHNWKLFVSSEMQAKKMLKSSFIHEAQQFLTDGGGRIWL